MVKKYVKKPVTVEAIRFKGIENLDDCRNFCKFLGYNEVVNEHYIDTLEGKIRVTYGDYIIKGVNGEFYPCKPDIFNKTYLKVDDLKVNEERD